MFQIPSWLLNATSAAQFAKNPGVPGWSDVLTGIGHSMADHARGTIATADHGVPPAAGAPSASPDIFGLLAHMKKQQAMAPSFGSPPLPVAAPPVFAPRPMPSLPPAQFTPHFQGLDSAALVRALGGQ